MLSLLKRARPFVWGALMVFGLVLISDPRLAATRRGQASVWGHTPPHKADPFIPAGTCQRWAQVNSNGFGLPSEFDRFNQPQSPISATPFRGEEGFEVLVFNDQLYLGMEADNQLGARLWRTRRGVRAPQSQLDWEEVSVMAGAPFGVQDLAQADHIDSLAQFEGWLYASTANRSENAQGTLIFRSPSGDPSSWVDALAQIGPGFGRVDNENFKDMQVFEGYLCGGTWNAREGAEVWCTMDGENWQQKNISGFGLPSNTIIWSGHVFDGQLYFGLQNTGDPEVEGDGDGRLFRTASLAGTPVWEEVFRTPAGLGWGNILGDLGGYLYISAPSKDGMRVYRSASGALGSWEIASLPGFEDNPNNQAVLADGAVTYRGGLYAGVVNGQTNFELWRTTGSPVNAALNWEKIPLDGMDTAYNIYAQLVTFNGALYAWTSNPVSGQQVWRTICGASD